MLKVMYEGKRDMLVIVENGKVINANEGITDTELLEYFGIGEIEGFRNMTKSEVMKVIVNINVESLDLLGKEFMENQKKFMLELEQEMENLELETVCILK